MRITAMCAGVGVAVGAVLLLALRFVVGPDAQADGLPRRYADYLPTGSTGWSDDVRVVSVVLGAGLAAGLLVGVLLWFGTARRAAGTGGRPRGAALTLAGLVVGTLLGGLVRGYGGGAVGGKDFGWYSSTSLGRDGVLYGGGVAEPSWWLLVLTGALVGLAVGAAAAGTAVAVSRHRRATEPTG